MITIVDLEYEENEISTRMFINCTFQNDVHRNGIPDGTHAVVNLAGQNIMDLKQWQVCHTFLSMSECVISLKVNLTYSLRNLDVHVY